MRTRRTLIILIVSLLAMVQVLAVSAATGKPPLSLESIFSGPEFHGNKLENVQWSTDGSVFTFTRRNNKTQMLDLYEHELASGENRLLISSDELIYQSKPIGMSGYQWTDNRRFLLITGPRVRTWDSVIEAPHYVYDTHSKSTKALADGNTTLRNVYLSHDGEHVGYVLDNNLYIANQINSINF